MKKLIFSALLLVLMSGLFAQSSIKVVLIANSTSVAPNGTIYTTTSISNNVNFIFDVVNTSASATNSYKVKRYDILLNATPTATATAYFCFAGNCYGNTVFVSPYSLTLTPGQKASQISGSYQTLTTDLDEADAVGHSIVKYSFINVNTPSDSLQMTIQYNDPVWLGVKDVDKESVSFSVLPNPTSADATIHLVSSNSFDSKVTVFNSIGQSVLEKPVAITEGKNSISINSSGFVSGVYFVSVKTGNKNLIKKLVVN